LSNEHRLGAVKDLQLAIKLFDFKKSILVVAGDTLFLNDFSIVEFIRNCEECPGSLVTHYTTLDSETSKTGILIARNEAPYEKFLRVYDFMEKPNPTETESRLACPCFYFLKPETFPLIQVLQLTILTLGFFK
jgi:glucose-1-phosphate thymidylyltransferase